MLDIEYIRYGKERKFKPGVPRITASSDWTFFFTKTTGSLYFLVDGLTETEQAEFSWSPLKSDRSPWVKFQLDRSVPMKEVRLYTQNGRLRSGRIVVGSKSYPFENPAGKNHFSRQEQTSNNITSTSWRYHHVFYGCSFLYCLQQDRFQIQNCTPGHPLRWLQMNRRQNSRKSWSAV